jgi:putative DNA primase/helicase
MWNELHDYADGRAFTDGIKAAASKFYGVAGRAFVPGVIGMAADLPERVKQFEQAFFARFVPADAGGQVKRVAACFALIAAAGELGREFGVLPWMENEAFDAAGLLFGEWLALRPTTGNLEEAQILAHVRALLEKSWASKFVDWERTINSDSDKAPDLSRMAAVHESFGFRKPDPAWTPANPQWLFYVTRSRFAEEFATKAGFKPKRVAAVLKSAGMLKSDPDCATLKETLPNGDPRSYCILGRAIWKD